MESEDPKRERLVGVAGRQSAVGSILEEEREASLRFLKYLFFFALLTVFFVLISIFVNSNSNLILGWDWHR